MAEAAPLERNIFDYAYNASSAAKYHLSIQLNQNNLYFLLIHITENKAIGFGSQAVENSTKPNFYIESLNNWLQDPLFSLPFQSISIYYSSKYSTLIPSGLFTENDGLDLMKFNFRLESNYSVSHNKIPALDANIVFSHPSELKKSLDEKFVSYQFKHSSSSTLTYFKEYTLRNPSPSIILDVDEDFFYLMVGKDKNLLLYNLFPYTNAEDFLYYTLYALEKLKINNEETSVNLCGKTNPHSAEFELLHKYFKRISFLDEHPGIEASFNLKEIETPSHFKLFNQYLCE